MPFKKDLLDELIKNCKTTEDIFGSEGIVKQLQKALVERMLNAEMAHHLNLFLLRIERKLPKISNPFIQHQMS